MEQQEFRVEEILSCGGEVQWGMENREKHNINHPQAQGGFWGVCVGQELDPWSLWVPSIRTFHDPVVEQPEPHLWQCIPQPAQHISQPIPKPSSGCLPAGVPRGAGGSLLHRAHGSFPVFQQDPGAARGHYIMKQLRD